MKSKRQTSEKPPVTSAMRGTKPTRMEAVHLPVPASGKPAINPQIRYEMIATAAYYRAERRGFGGGSELEDWLEAEAEIDGTLSGTAFQYH